MEGLTAQDILEEMYGPGCVDRVAEIVVITKGSRYRSHGQGKSDTPIFWPFRQGEILFLDDRGREPFGERRKPGKWDVEVRACPTLAEARVVSDVVKEMKPVFMPDYKSSWTPEERKRFDG